MPRRLDLRGWLPEGCRADGDEVICPRDALRRLVVAASAAIMRARLLERSVEELEERCEAARGLREEVEKRLAVIESELGWVRDQLVELERLAGELAGLWPRVEEVVGEVERVRGEARRLLERVERWRVVWECGYSIPHPESIRRRCGRGRPRLCLLADKARQAKLEFYSLLWSLPVLERGEGRVLVFREADAKRLEGTWRRLFSSLVEELRREGYRTRAYCRCARRLMAPEQLVEEVEEELERLRGEIERLERRAEELRRAGKSASSFLHRAELLRKRLRGLEAVLRELREKLPRDAKVPTAVGTR